ncbi:MAG: hypothetical protein AMXMBFR44_5460 [Candidatus Campbellbacteria bacterium]
MPKVTVITNRNGGWSQAATEEVCGRLGCRVNIDHWNYPWAMVVGRECTVEEITAIIPSDKVNYQVEVVDPADNPMVRKICYPQFGPYPRNLSF